MKCRFLCLLLIAVPGWSGAMSMGECFSTKEWAYQRCLEDAGHDHGWRRHCAREQRTGTEFCSKLPSYEPPIPGRFVPIPIPQRQVYILPGMR